MGVEEWGFTDKRIEALNCNPNAHGQFLARLIKSRLEANGVGRQDGSQPLFAHSHRNDKGTDECG